MEKSPFIVGMFRLSGGSGDQLRLHQECKEGGRIRQEHCYKEGYRSFQRQDLLCEGTCLQDSKRCESLRGLQQREESEAVKYLITVFI